MLEKDLKRIERWLGAAAKWSSEMELLAVFSLAQRLNTAGGYCDREVHRALETVHSARQNALSGERMGTQTVLHGDECVLCRGVMGPTNASTVNQQRRACP